MSKTLVNEVLTVSATFKNNRTKNSIISHLKGEIEELDVEVKISNGELQEPHGSDGVVGEAIDCILCLLDLIYIDNPDITEHQLTEIANKKLAKWVSKYK